MRETGAIESKSIFPVFLFASLLFFLTSWYDKFTSRITG